MSENINNIKFSKKIIWNAISAYLMIFISWLFFFNKSNKDINNDFVKLHTKSAFLIHLWFLITYIIFILFWLFSNIHILNIWLNHIITNIIFILLTILLIIWIHYAKNWKIFKININIKVFKKNEILNILWNSELNEKDKLILLISYIPFIWFLNYWKYSKNLIIKENTRVSLLITLVILLLYISNYWDIADLFLLVFLIFISFVWINLFVQDKLIQIKLPKIFSPNYFHTFIIVFSKYIINYFSEKKFKEYKQILIEQENKIIEQEKINFENLKNKKSLKQKLFLIYIPFINLFFIFFLNSKYYFHIINWITITFLTIIFLILNYFNIINSYFYLIILIPIMFWIWFTKNKLAYKMPFIFDLFFIISKIISILSFLTKKLNKKRKEVNELNLKVDNNLEKEVIINNKKDL